MAKDFKSELKNLYNIKESDIVKVSAVNEKDIEAGLYGLQLCLKGVANKDDAEVLVAYFGHGSSITNDSSLKIYEGAKEGIIINENITETKVKNLFKKYLDDVKTLFMLQSCNSGAWISKNTKDTAKNLNRFV